MKASGWRVFGWVLLVLGIIYALWVIGIGMQMAGGADSETLPSYGAVAIHAVVAAAFIAGGIYYLRITRPPARPPAE